MNICSTSLALRGIQAKTTRYHFTLARMAIIKKTVSVGEMEKSELVLFRWECKMMQPFGKMVFNYSLVVKQNYCMTQQFHC